MFHLAISSFFFYFIVTRCYYYILYFYFPFLFSLPFSHRNVTELLPHFFYFTFLFVHLFGLYIICRKYQSEAVIKTIKYRKIFFNEGICIRTKKKELFQLCFFRWILQPVLFILLSSFIIIFCIFFPSSNVNNLNYETVNCIILFAFESLEPEILAKFLKIKKLKLSIWITNFQILSNILADSFKTVANKSTLLYKK